MPCRFNSSVPSHPAPRLRPLAIAIGLALLPGLPAYAMDASAATAAAPAAESVLQVITITGTHDDSGYKARDSASASKLNLTLRDTPQSVSVVTRARMDDFKLDNANDVLANTTGVTVEKVETDRTYYVSRGFDIINFQYDGVGMPFVFGNVYGDLDTALYDRIDIVRAANGLSASTGNPSAAVNFLRKRPTSQAQATAALSVGSWNTRRLEADVSAPLNSSGTVKGRAVLATQDGDSYLDRYEAKKNVAYAVVDARLGADTLLTVGHSYQKNRNNGGMWGALPLHYSDGSPTSYPVGASTSADWSRWVTQTQSTFAELHHSLGQHWNLKGVFTHSTFNTDSKLLYVYGTPDKASGGGLYSYPSLYRADQSQRLFDLGVTGQFQLGGRAHDLSFGVNWSRSQLDDQSRYGRGIGTEMNGAGAFNGAYPEPLFDASLDGSSYEDKRKNAYLAARFHLNERTKLLAGFNAAKAESIGNSYGVSKLRSASDTTPYIGLVYDISDKTSAYASYTEIFNPQSETDINGNTLAPIMGSSAEVGIKTELLDDRLQLTGAVFRARQSNTAEQGGYVGAKSWYRGIDAQSEGVELELSGELAKGWMASAGFTHLAVDDNAGKAVRAYVPRKLLRLSTTYRVAALPRLKIGANLNWQSDTERDQGEGLIARQDSHAVLGLMARYDISDRLALAVNLNNVTDKKHLTSLYWSQAYYAAPRNGSVTLHWKY